MRPSRKVFAALGHLNSFSYRVYQQRKLFDCNLYMQYVLLLKLCLRIFQIYYSHLMSGNKNK
jgi:hypothetical protein